MKNLKIINENELKDWAKEIFAKNSFNMVDVSSKKETFRRALSSGKIYVGKEVFDLIKNKKMPKGDPITLAEVSAVLGVKKTSELIPLCHPIPIDHNLIVNAVINSVTHSARLIYVVLHHTIDLLSKLYVSSIMFIISLFSQLFTHTASVATFAMTP